MVSSNRYFVKKVDVTTLTDGFYRERERLALYLLNDSLEIAKWRNRSHGTSLLKVHFSLSNNFLNRLDATSSCWKGFCLDLPYLEVNLNSRQHAKEIPQNISLMVCKMCSFPRTERLAIRFHYWSPPAETLRRHKICALRSHSHKNFKWT